MSSAAQSGGYRAQRDKEFFPASEVAKAKSVAVKQAIKKAAASGSSGKASEAKASGGNAKMASGGKAALLQASTASTIHRVSSSDEEREQAPAGTPANPITLETPPPISPKLNFKKALVGGGANKTSSPKSAAKGAEAGEKPKESVSVCQTNSRILVYCFSRGTS